MYTYIKHGCKKWFPELLLAVIWKEIGWLKILKTDPGCFSFVLFSFSVFVYGFHFKALTKSGLIIPSNIYIYIYSVPMNRVCGFQWVKIPERSLLFLITQTCSFRYFSESTNKYLIRSRPFLMTQNIFQRIFGDQKIN